MPNAHDSAAQERPTAGAPPIPPSGEGGNTGPRDNSPDQNPQKWWQNHKDWSHIFQAVGVALGVGVAWIYWSQLQEMSDQTRHLSEQANRSVIENRGNAATTKQQLTLLQQQARAAQDGVKAIQEQVRQDQRAWMHFTQTSITISRDAQGRVDVQTPVGMYATGKTPATKIRMEFVVEIVKNEPHKIYKFPYANIPRTTSTSGTSVPGEPNEQPIPAHLLKVGSSPNLAEIRMLSASEYQELANGKTFIILYGRIRYRDVFNIPHETRYCRFHSPSGKSVYAQDCTEYNGVDDNR